VGGPKRIQINWESSHAITYPPAIAGGTDCSTEIFDF
jgi:hypothetical protein